MIDRAQAVALVRGLVEIPSLSRNEQAAARWLADQMRTLGYERAFVDEAGNAVGELGPAEASHVIVLLGHIDTVPGDIRVRIEPANGGDVLYGRGSVDAKGPLAALVAGAARWGAARGRESNLRVVVVGAVEEEAATSRGARFIAARFDGSSEPVPKACVIGEPSHWHRVTLGYKGRLLLDLFARQSMTHTAGPDASVAAVVVDLWNWVTADAASTNAGREKAFDQLSPSLRRFITATTPAMDDTAEAQIAWRLPTGIDVDEMVNAMLWWAADHVEAARPETRVRLTPAPVAGKLTEEDHSLAVTLPGRRTTLSFRFRGVERPWRGDRQNALVRSFLGAIRATDPTIQPGFVLKTGTSDMNVVAPIWRCPIVAYGPGDSALDHTPDEHLALDEYWRAVQVVEGMLRGFAQTASM